MEAVVDPADVLASPIAEAVTTTVPRAFIVAVVPEIDNTEGLPLENLMGFPAEDEAERVKVPLLTKLWVACGVKVIV
jgi:hypothetical protein